VLDLYFFGIPCTASARFTGDGWTPYACLPATGGGTFLLADPTVAFFHGAWWMWGGYVPDGTMDGHCDGIGWATLG
jgi:hypothetical protein